MQSFIITLTGASGCGKTYVMDKISEASIKLEKIGLVFKPKRIKKQTTRNYRIEEIIEIIDGKIDNIDVESVVKLDDDCDLVYQTYGKKYGLKLSVLENALKNNECPVVIINDVRVVEELKKKFPNRVLSLYIFREIPNYDKLKKLSSGRGAVSDEEVRGRFNKAVAIHRTYIENITLFDKVILNIKKYNKQSGEFDYTGIQIFNIIKATLENKYVLGLKKSKGNKLFIICGNATSGKDQIIRSINDMGKMQAFIWPKYTTRSQDSDDGTEMMCKYIPRTDIMEKYNTEYKNEYNFLKFKSKILIENASKEFVTDNKKNNLIESMKENYDLLKKLKTPIETFWNDVKKFKTEQYFQFCLEQKIINSFENKNISLEELNLIIDQHISKDEKILILKNEFIKQLEEKIVKNFFEINSKNYIDIEKIKKENSNIIKLQTKDQIKGMTGPAYYVEHAEKGLIMYENNDTLYAFIVEERVNNELINLIKNKMDTENKHCVLVASLINIFDICEKKFGKDNVIKIFSSSQISLEDFKTKTKNINEDTLLKKAKQFEKEIKKYSEYIEYFDHVTIFAKESIGNTGGSPEEELIDQMFRLFRAYNI